MSRRLLDWEPIDGGHDDEDKFEFRARVPGGWLIKICSMITSDNPKRSEYEAEGLYQSSTHTSRVEAITFYPDPHHKWEPGPVEHKESDKQRDGK